MLLNDNSDADLVSYFAIFIRWVFKKVSLSILKSNYLFRIGKAQKLGNKLLRQKLLEGLLCSALGIQFYYNKDDVCKKTDPNIVKIGLVTSVLRNWPISDRCCQNLKISANFWDWDPIKTSLLNFHKNNISASSNQIINISVSN